jgi:tRNA C32,U32 (ribose-2'-O)-methylase TrmJ
MWTPALSPPALLEHVTLVLVSPKRPITLGTVARAASAFEAEAITIVEPRCEDYLTRSAKNASKGAQYIMWRAKHAATLGEALAGADYSVCFTRWIAGREGTSFRDVPSLLAAPPVQALLSQPPGPGGGGEGGGDGGRRTRLALVFGREEHGLSDAEIDSCDAACSIPIGRLQESLSLSHAVSIVLSALFRERLAAAGAWGSGGGGGGGSAYAVDGLAGLAAGFDASEGTER